MKRSAWGLGLSVSSLALVLAASCSEVARNYGQGERCSLNSDCRAPLVCGFERCRAECKTSRDCNGKLCVRGNLGGNICQLDDEVACTHNSECAGTQLCGADRRCRDVCITDKDCVTDLLCASHVCAKPEELVNGQLPQKAADEAGAGCTYATDCPGDLVCLYGTCDVECLGDKDCLSGWVCKPQRAGGDGRCYPGSPVDAGKDASGADAFASDASDASDVGTGADGAADAGDASDAGPPPPPVPTTLAAGETHVCVIFSNGKVKCWGQNDVGQLGLGDTAHRGDGPNEMGDNLPYVDLGAGRTAKALSSNAFSTCAILDNDKVKCWGQNDLGQLGLGDTATRGDGPNEMGDNLPYVDLGAGRTAKRISTNSFTTCAILDNDKVKCWGQNNVGQLCVGDTTVRGDGPNEMGDNLPYADLGTGRTAKSLTSCRGSTCAILDNDKVKCWGWNQFAALGSGDLQNRGDQNNEIGDSLPYVDLGVGRTAKALSAQGNSVCAILDNDKVKCWGWNGFGNLGLGDVNWRGDVANEMGDNLPYVNLGTGRTAKALSTSRDTVCVLLDNDKVKCWGLNGSGQLGYGDVTTRGNAPNQMGDNLLYVDLGTGRTPKALRGARDSNCALLDNDKVKCWGWNATGILGLGDTMTRGTLANQMGDDLPYVLLLGP